jgi:exodeoxyribonuclease V alpha subunit
LEEAPDIGPRRAALIASAWEEQKQIKEVMLFLHSHGVSTNLAVKIYKQYGEQALEIVRSDPYRLARDIYGVGFKTADRIARALGLPEDAPGRIQAGVVYTLNQASDDGNVYLPRQELEQQAVQLLGVAPELASPAIEQLAQDKFLRVDILPLDETIYSPGSAAGALATAVQEAGATYGQQAVYLAPLYFSEAGVAEHLRSLAAALPSRLCDLPPAFVTLDASLSPEQKVAIQTALSHPLSVLTGGPGTGKTTALKALIAALEAANKTFALASPTGRAAKRLSQATGRSASTLHRLLGFAPGEGFKFNAENTLPVDLVVVDEASMLDLALTHNLLKAIEPGTHLLLVGDVDQLPSVGAGDVLRDVIASQIAPVTRLSVIFRQAAASQIITNAHRINQGQPPLFSSAGEAQDFFLFSAETPEEAAGWVEQVVCTRIPQKFNLHPVRDIQVLSPMYRGPAGVTALNERLQNRLNPADPLKPERNLFGQLFRTGDKLMQTRNNYDKDVYNGDTGNLFGIDPVEQTLVIDFEGRAVSYDWSEADQLVLAYAVSVHKAQGSEYPAVVLPLVTQHYMMLQRNLLYTAVTRARRLCVLVGSRKAINMAVRNDQVARRYTALDLRLKRVLR